MNEWVQNIIIGIAVILAALFFIKKFFWRSSKNSCDKDGCGCH
ncbi:MAG: FeoB-associated Cys-rich membrane protein [Flavobacteriaceae bacterium]|jgi:hypothetical protein|nr:FeoB-associated Cys-rich membrane protein [Flavobacteriaceae bacterium]